MLAEYSEYSQQFPSERPRGHDCQHLTAGQLHDLYISGLDSKGCEYAYVRVIILSSDWTETGSPTIIVTDSESELHADRVC